MPCAELVHDLDRREVCWQGRSLAGLDAVVVKKLGDSHDEYIGNRLLALEELERGGTRVISAPGAIRDAVNRYRMSYLLRAAGIPMPRTAVTESVEEAVSLVSGWGAAVLKPLFTSKGRGMEKLSARSAVRLALSRWQREGRGPMYLQEFVPAPGRDLAVAVLGDRVVGAYYRVATPGKWMTTTAAGGHYERAEIGPDLEELAVRAARVFGLAFTSVDLVETDGGWLVYEVSAFGGFSGLQKACNVDGAALYADYVMEALP
jgi:ribosomal protein S6--L-glutamate ligase